MNKYRNTWTRCNQGHNHQSKKEADYCSQLELLKKVGKIKEYYSQVKFPLFVNITDAEEKEVCDIIVDFLIIKNNEKKEIHEVKSKVTMIPLWKLKKKIFEANYPDIKYIVIGGK
jgi:hypothetical protein